MGDAPDMPRARRHLVPSNHRPRKAAVLVRRAHRAPTKRPRSAGSIFLGLLVTATLAILVVLAGGIGIAGIVAASSISALSEGLPDPSQLESLSFPEATVVYDRTGKHQLAQFQQEQRKVLAYDQFPELVLD